jgi:alkylation response protein AidB-like acyl-CoA dehydrogenase
MDVGFREEQELLRKSAADFLSKECPMTYVRQMMEDERGYADAVWGKMAELGWTGLIYPEEFGGAGFSMVDLVVVLEEMGKASLPGPFFSTVCLGGLAILEAGSDEQKKKYLPGLASGQTRTPGGTRKGSTSRHARERKTIASAASSCSCRMRMWPI